MDLIWIILGLISVFHIDLSLGSCDLSIKLANGNITFIHDIVIKFKCNPGYTMQGYEYHLCYLKNQPLPFCAKSGCSKLEKPENGAFMKPIGEKAVVMCNDGYVLDGTRFAYCDGKNWTNKLGKCLESSHKKDQSCDFESEDQCGWQADKTFGISWRRTRDHTSDGYFMSLSTTCFDVNCHYQSPIFPRMLSLNNSFFRFRYKIEGNDKGLLVVSVKPFSLSLKDMQSGKYGNFSKMAISRSQKDWHEETIAIDTMDTDFQIVFTFSPNGVNSVGVDNVKLMTGQTDKKIAEKTFELTNSTISTYLTDNDLTTSPRTSCLNRCNQILLPSMDEVAYEGTYIKECGCSEDCVADDNCCDDFIDECLTKNNEETKESIPNKGPTPQIRIFESIPTTPIKMSCSNRCGQIMRPGMDHVALDGTYIKGCGCSVHCIKDDNCCDNYFEECQSKEHEETEDAIPTETAPNELSTPLSTNPISAQNPTNFQGYLTYLRTNFMVTEAEGEVNNIDMDVIEMNASYAD